MHEKQPIRHRLTCSFLPNLLILPADILFKPVFTLAPLCPRAGANSPCGGVCINRYPKRTRMGRGVTPYRRKRYRIFDALQLWNRPDASRKIDNILKSNNNFKSMWFGTDIEL
jgi:hypothetical protein